MLALQGFWETAGFGLNVVLFLLVGMQIDARMLLAEAGAIAARACVALHVGRAVAVYGCFAVLRAVSSERVPLRWQHVMVFGNIKGALSMAAVLALPAGLPYRARLVTIVFGVTFVTLVTQALPFRAVPARAQGHARRARRRRSTRRGHADRGAARPGGARRAARGRARSRAREHAERRAAFQRVVIDAEAQLRTPGGGRGATIASSTRALLHAQKAALLDAARRGLVGSETAERRRSQRSRLARSMRHLARRRRALSMRIVIAGAGRAGLERRRPPPRSAGTTSSSSIATSRVRRRAFEQHGLVVARGRRHRRRGCSGTPTSRGPTSSWPCSAATPTTSRVALLAQAAGAKRVMVRMRDTEYRSVYVAAGVRPDPLGDRRAHRRAGDRDRARGRPPLDGARRRATSIAFELDVPARAPGRREVGERDRAPMPASPRRASSRGWPARTARSRLRGARRSSKAG